MLKLGTGIDPEKLYRATFKQGHLEPGIISPGYY